MAKKPVQVYITEQEFQFISDESQRTGKSRASVLASLFRTGLTIRDMGTIIVKADDGTMREVVIYAE